MDLSANKFGWHLIAIGEYKLKDNIVELLILVHNWMQLWGFFSNAHICEGLSLETEVPPQFDNGVFVLNWNFTFLLPILLTFTPVYWRYQRKLDITPFLVYHFFSKCSLGDRSNYFWFQVSLNIFFLWSDLLFFSSVALIYPFDTSVCFVGFPPFIVSSCLFG